MPVKNKFCGRRKYRFGFAGKVFLTLVLALGLMGAALLPSKAAEEKLDPGHQRTLTVKGNKEITSEELKAAGVVVDLYQVAKAEPLSERYSYTSCAPFAGLGEIPTDLDAKGWQGLAQKAAGIVLNSTGREKALREAVRIDQKVEGLDAGLYLLIARGRETQDYAGKNADGDIVTKADTDECTYRFSPVLAAVPGRESAVSGEQAFGKWIYDVEAVLKAERQTDEEYGSLKIVKTLNGFASGGDPATFVFQVEAVLGGKKVYSNVVTLVFDKEGKKELLVENIPVGSKVTVTEVYNGASYSLVTDQKKTVTIDAEGFVSTVDFTNKYDGRENGGHGITNHFTYEKGEWKFKQLLDKSQG